jgi:hypothetical protein
MSSLRKQLPHDAFMAYLGRHELMPLREIHVQKISQYIHCEWHHRDKVAIRRTGNNYFLESKSRPREDDAPVETTESKFAALSRQWRQEIAAESSLSRITGNINYLRVIAMGEKVIPLILKELKRAPAPWFVALRALTGQRDIGAEHSGNFRKIADSWVEWGERRGYI